jgi:hypothetical protein
MANLRIHDWCNEYRVARDQPEPQTFGSGLDRLPQRLAEALADKLDGMLGGDAGAVLLLPSLVVDCEIDTACPPDRIAARWARQLTLAFARALDDPASALVRFPSRAAWQARFIGELVRGRGWDSWLYRHFEGLRSLPTAAVIRTLLTEDAATGRATLALLDEASWSLLPGALSNREAVRILCHWHGQEDSGDATQLPLSALVQWARAAPSALGAVPPPLLALWLLARIAMQPCATHVGAVCWLATFLLAPPPLPPTTLRDPAGAADLRAIADTAESFPDKDWLALLAGTPPPQRQAAAELAAAARQAAAEPGAAPSATLPEEFDAPFGGLAWLLPALHDLLDAAVVAALPSRPCEDCRSADLAALLTVALACGARSESVWRDPFWRSFFRVPPGFDMAALDRWLAPCEPAAFDAALAASLQRRALTDTVVLRIPIAGRSLRLAVERGSASRLHARALDGSPRGSSAGCSPLDGSSLPLTALPFAERLMLSRLLRRDGDFLAAGHLLRALPDEWRESFGTLAQATLRRTAFRIPGAARCSLPWLFANVLNVRGRASCAARPSGTAWQLELVRAPLHVLLSLNGMARLKLAWPDSRTLVVHCEE